MWFLIFRKHNEGLPISYFDDENLNNDTAKVVIGKRHKYYFLRLHGQWVKYSNPVTSITHIPYAILKTAHIFRLMTVSDKYSHHRHSFFSRIIPGIDTIICQWYLLLFHAIQRTTHRKENDYSK